MFIINNVSAISAADLFVLPTGSEDKHGFDNILYMITNGTLHCLCYCVD